MARLSPRTRFGSRRVSRQSRRPVRIQMTNIDGRDLEAENKDLRGRVKRLESALNRMTSQCVNHGVENARLKKELENTTGRIDALTHSFDFLEAEYRELIEAMSSLEVENERLKEQLTENVNLAPETVDILNRITEALHPPPKIDQNVAQTAPCCICLGSMADAFMFLPCCHVCCCRECFSAGRIPEITLTKCPVCRTQIDVALRAYVS